MTTFNVTVAREYTDKQGEVKTSWKDIGMAMETKNGIRVNLHFQPIVKGGEPETIFLFPRKPNGGSE